MQAVEKATVEAKVDTKAEAVREVVAACISDMAAALLP